MAISTGTEQYKADVPPVKASGLLLSDEELEEALTSDVAEIVHDLGGWEILSEILEGIEETDFDDTQIKALLSHKFVPEDWRVGEALAQAFLAAHRNCTFPWPASRDLRNPVSSPAGTDLVGFVDFDSEELFAFGEVKTSTQQQWPPSLIYGRHGLKQQMEDLRDSFEHKDALVRYLGFHSLNAPWLDKCKSAAKKYIASKLHVALFAVLVRDVTPNSADLSARASSLATGCPPDSKIELLAIYLPANMVPTLSQRCKKGGGDDETMTIPRTSLETLEKHWAIDALGQAGRLKAFAISNAWLVKQATGKQLHVSFVDSPGDLALLERAALAYELAALEGVHYLLYPGSDVESSRLRDQAQAAAFQCFQLSQVLPVPEQREKSIFHVLHLAGLAYAADRWNDLRRWIRDQGETIAAPSVAEVDWDKRLLFRIFTETSDNLTHAIQIIPAVLPHESEPAVIKGRQSVVCLPQCAVECR